MGRSAVPVALLAVSLLGGPLQSETDIHHNPTGEATNRGRAPDTSTVVDEGSAGRFNITPAGLYLGAGELREPLGLAVDARGFVYVADAMTGKVFRYGEDGGSLEFEQPPRTASLYPIDLAAYGTFIYVLDYVENRIVRYDTKGAYLDILLSFNELERVHPASLTAGEGGRIVTTDIEHHTVTVWTPLLDVELTVGEYGWSAGKFDRPTKAALLPDDRIAVVDAGNRRVQLFTPAGGFERLLTLPDGEQFRSPRSVTVDSYGFIYVTDSGEGRVVVFTAGGEFVLNIETYGDAEIAPASLTVGWNDRLYIADLVSRSILVYDIHYP
ncbi:MAG: NHL repeat-containing protein [bacterium]|nr:MAG: NHL repeat-containing protein [bacterium]